MQCYYRLGMIPLRLQEVRRIRHHHVRPGYLNHRIPRLSSPRCPLTKSIIGGVVS